MSNEPVEQGLSDILYNFKLTNGIRLPTWLPLTKVYYVSFLFLWLNKGLIQRASKDCGLLVVIVNKKEWDIKAYLNTFNLD